MAVDWGPWETSGGNGIRVGIEVTVTEGGGGAINHGSVYARFTVEYWTENQHTYGDTQTLNLGGAITGPDITFNNNDGGAPVKRGTEVYNYTYPANSYGSSPGSKTFAATLSGAYNGVSPSNSVTKTIPARPYDNPAVPNAQSVSRVSDETNKVSWNNRPTSGEPYSTVLVDRWIYGYGSYGGSPGWVRVANLGASAESYTDGGATPNRKYTYRIGAENSAGGSGWSPNTNLLWTAPATPTSPLRAPSGANQVITWTNNVDYAEHGHEVWVSQNGAAFTLLATVGAGVATYTHTAPSTASKWKYKVRAKTTSGTQLYSSFSAETTETTGTTSAPNAPTNLAPTGSIVLDSTGPIVLTWQHNPTDGTAQTDYLVHYREVGSSTWIETGPPEPSPVLLTGVGANNPTKTLGPGTFGYAKSIEWQVQTWGATGPSTWSATATFVTSPAVAVKYPIFLDLTTGRMEASSSASLVSPCPDIPWFDLTLVNGWENYLNGYVTAGACRIGGVVFLRGLVRNGSTGSICNPLPVGMRPTGRDIFVAAAGATGAASAGTAHTHPGGTNRVDVLDDGTVTQIAGPNGYLDLAQIAFPAAGCGSGTWPNVGTGVDIMTGLTNSGTLVAGNIATIPVAFPVPFPAAGPLPRVVATLDSPLSSVNMFVTVTAVTRNGFSLVFRRDTGTVALDAHWHAIGGSTFGSGGIGPEPSWKRVGSDILTVDGTYASGVQNIGKIAIPESHWVNGRIFRAYWSGGLVSDTAGAYTNFFLRYGTGASNGIATQQVADLVFDHRAAGRRMAFMAVAELPPWPLVGATPGTAYNVVAVISGGGGMSRHYAAGVNVPCNFYLDAFY